MKFHKEGWPTLFVALVFSLIINLIAFYFFPSYWIAKTFSITLSLFLIIVVLQFFRSPLRNWNKNNALVISPADGKVVVIEQTQETEYFKDQRIQVSVFMSPINVHVNRYPMDGKVDYVKYHPGKFLVAWDPKSSTDNERTTVVVSQSSGFRILFRQIAGALARRIVIYAKEGEQATQTDEFGFIKFGSRVDIFFPVGTEILVQPGQVVKGGITPLAKIPSV
jgi:phosphatidylserine decarboxylase